jgi:hypothetical protein
MARIDARVMEVGEGAQYEEEIVGPDGFLRTYVTNKVPLFDQNGGVYGLCGFATDITERKMSEKHMAESQRRLQLAVDAAAAGTFVWNCQTGLLEWDERSLEIFGLQPDAFKRPSWTGCATSIPTTRSASPRRCKSTFPKCPAGSKSTAWCVPTAKCAWCPRPATSPWGATANRRP